MALARTALTQLNHPYSNPYDFFTPHPVAGQFLFADGSVHSLSKTMSGAIWQAIGTRNGGEVMPSSEF